jgi:hypothetical protein
VFSGIIKFLSPYLLSSTKALGKEVLRSGSELLSDLGTQPISKLLQHQGKKSAKNLADKATAGLKRMSGDIMTGDGIKRRKANVDSVIRGLINQQKTPAPKAKTRKKRSTPNKRGSAKKRIVRKHTGSSSSSKTKRKGKSSKKIAVEAAKNIFLKKYLGH